MQEVARETRAVFLGYFSDAVKRNWSEHTIQFYIAGCINDQLSDGHDSFDSRVVMKFLCVDNMGKHFKNVCREKKEMRCETKSYYSRSGMEFFFSLTERFFFCRCNYMAHYYSEIQVVSLDQFKQA